MRHYKDIITDIVNGRLYIYSDRFKKMKFDFISQILSEDKPSLGIELLKEKSILKQILPDIFNLLEVDVKDGKYHKNIYYHTLKVLDNVAQRTNKLEVRWAALFHDVGKPKSKHFNPGIGWTFHNHEGIGASIVNRLLSNIPIPESFDKDLVVKLVKLHMKPTILTGDVTDSAVRRLITDLGDDLEDILILSESDITTSHVNKLMKFLDNLKQLRSRLDQIKQSDYIRDFKIPINGFIIMETFNIEAGPIITEIKDYIKSAIMNGEIENDFDQARELMLKYAESKGLKSVK